MVAHDRDGKIDRMVVQTMAAEWNRALNLSQNENNLSRALEHSLSLL